MTKHRTIRAAVTALALTLTAGCTPQDVIRTVWASHGATPQQQDQAVNVAWCESTLDSNAVNGQYRGWFQLGHMHDHYLNGGSVWDGGTNADAAWQLWADSGGWGPWSCG